MQAPLQLKERGVQILQLLKQHGPLSFKGLKQIISPAIKDRRLHGAIARLTKNGVVVRRQERVFRGAGIFYQLAQEELQRRRIAIALGCTSEELRQPFFRHRELIHTEVCALWANRLKAVFPCAKLVRDFEFYKDKAAHEILLTNRDDYELRPDILLTFEGSENHVPVSIAFEVERTRKSGARLLAKLRKYADETTLDGVVYICESTQVSDPIRHLFKSKVSTKSLRISQYGEQFFLFSNDTQVQTGQPVQMLNANLTQVLLSGWIDHLRSTPLTLRRSENFEVGAVSCSEVRDRSIEKNS